MEAGEGTNPDEQRDIGCRFSAFGKSIPNPEHPRTNEDAFFVDQRGGLAMVLDGMGGLSNGDRASQTAREVLVKNLALVPGKDEDLQTVKDRMKQVLVEASDKVRQDVPRGGTTATVVKFLNTPDGQIRAVIGHVGDSRAYLVRLREGRFDQLTEDDNTLTASITSPEERRRIQRQLDNVEKSQDIATPEEYGYFGKRNIINQYLGKKGIAPHIYDIAVTDGDIILLTTDGVHDNMTFDELRQAAVSNNVEELVNAVVDHSKWRVTGEEEKHRLSDQPVLQRIKAKVEWRLKGEPKHFRAKPDDITAVAIKVTQLR